MKKATAITCVFLDIGGVPQQTRKEHDHERIEIRVAHLPLTKEELLAP